MSLRITQGMLFDRALLDVRSGLLDRLRIQEQVATGRRVNRPSDDPSAALRILPLRARIQDFGRILENVDLARESLDLGAAALEDASEIMQRLREVTVEGANGSKSESDRKSMAAEVDQLLQQMLGVANARRADGHLFGGARTEVSPFELVVDGGGSRVVYRGDGGRTRVEVAPGVSTAINVPGDGIFLARDREPTIFAGETGAKPSGASDSGVGFDELQVTFDSLSIPAGTSGIAQGSGTTTALGALSYVYSAGPPATLSINGGPATTITGGDQDFPVGSSGKTTVSLKVTTPVSPASGTLTSRANLSIDGGKTKVLVDDFSPGKEFQVKNSYDGTVLNVDVSGLSATGTERVTYPGTFDAFTVLIAVRDTLRNDEGLSSQQVSERLTFLLGQIDRAHDSILDGLHDQGVRSEHMQAMRSRIQSMRENGADSLSRVQDADLAESISRMTQADFAFQASLGVAARIMQTSLLAFLR